MKKLFLLFCFLAGAQADDNKTTIYLAFEGAYIHHDVATIAPWLADKFTASETVHIPQKGSRTHSLSREELLARIKVTPKPLSWQHSLAKNVVVKSNGQNGFCASAALSDDTVVHQQRYKRQQTRTACFVKKGSHYLVTRFAIDLNVIVAAGK
ncbi:hypothetical protein [Gallaecimonas mangrovi]|uniref:hypothetical protein n=1 Tax=Gallaecimonas mangrovi TaxID=2291597 RepID=UPI000E208AD4|nr:hypothetical protein [Gallaecimonas mangrovi]